MLPSILSVLLHSGIPKAEVFTDKCFGVIFNHQKCLRSLSMPLHKWIVVIFLFNAKLKKYEVSLCQEGWLHFWVCLSVLVYACLCQLKSLWRSKVLPCTHSDSLRVYWGPSWCELEQICTFTQETIWVVWVFLLWLEGGIFLKHSACVDP